MAIPVADDTFGSRDFFFAGAGPNIWPLQYSAQKNVF